MFVLPPKIAQATEALLTIALADSARPLSGKRLAEYLDVPPRFLEQTMQQLVHAGLLTSVRGPRGGYRLAKEPRAINLGLLSDALCDASPVETAVTGTNLGRDVVRPAYQKAEDHLHAYLTTVTLADLCADSGLAEPAEDLAERMTVAI